MSRTEERLLRRRSGPHIIIASVALGLAGASPLLLYIAFGPPDGNPIGLGLLAAAAIPFAGMGILIGLIKLIVQHVGHRGA